MAASASMVMGIYDKIYHDQLKYCCLCLRTEEERRLVRPKALAVFAKIFKPGFKFVTPTWACEMCEARAASAVRFMHAFNFAFAVNSVFREMSKAKKHETEVKQHFNKVKMNTKFNVMDDWDAKLEDLRAQTQLIQSEVLIVDTLRKQMKVKGREERAPPAPPPPPPRPAPALSPLDTESLTNVVIVMDDDDEEVAAHAPPATDPDMCTYFETTHHKWRAPGWGRRAPGGGRRARGRGGDLAPTRSRPDPLPAHHVKRKSTDDTGAGKLPRLALRSAAPPRPAGPPAVPTLRAALLAPLLVLGPRPPPSAPPLSPPPAPDPAPASPQDDDDGFQILDAMWAKKLSEIQSVPAALGGAGRARGAGAGAGGSDELLRVKLPVKNTDRIDWEDQIPMDVISLLNASTPPAPAEGAACGLGVISDVRSVPPAPPDLIDLC